MHIHLTQVCQTCFAYNLFGAFFKLFKRIWNQHEILRFFTFFKGHISSFYTSKPNAQKRLKKILFSKFVLDFNFAPIKESGFIF